MIKNFIPIITTILFILINGIAYCDNEPSYDNTVNLIKETMYNSTSEVRKESYDYIKFDKCSLNYNVIGAYPFDDIYNIKFVNIDFSSLNYQNSKVGHDYTAFIILNFKNGFRSKNSFKEIIIHTLVVNVSTDEKAQVLFNAFLHLGELCDAPKSPL